VRYKKSVLVNFVGTGGRQFKRLTSMALEGLNILY